MAEIDLVPCDSILSRLEDELKSYSSNNILDVGALLTQVKWFSQLLGIAVYEQKETILTLTDYQAQLPCNFYLLDSAWLCDAFPTSSQLNFQSNLVVYTETVDETVCNNGNPCLPTTNCMYPISISTCNMETVLDKTTTTEYVYSNPNNQFTWHNPILLNLNNKKNVRAFCSKDCQNMFANSPYDISIARRGDSFYLSSTLKDPIIYVKYYAYPIDEETNLPLVPSDPILVEALFKHLEYYFFRSMFLDGGDTNIENKVKFLKEESELAVAGAIKYSVFPTYNKMIANTKRMRKKFSSFEIMNTRHR